MSRLCVKGNEVKRKDDEGGRLLLLIQEREEGKDGVALSYRRRLLRLSGTSLSSS